MTHQGPYLLCLWVFRGKDALVCHIYGKCHLSLMLTLTRAGQRSKIRSIFLPSETAICTLHNYIFGFLPTEMNILLHFELDWFSLVKILISSDESHNLTKYEVKSFLHLLLKVACCQPQFSATLLLDCISFMRSEVKEITNFEQINDMRGFALGTFCPSYIALNIFLHETMENRCTTTQNTKEF